MSVTMTIGEYNPGSREHYNIWHPQPTSHVFEFQQLSSTGETWCFRCIAAEQGVEDPTPSIIVHAWAQTPDEAQYHAYKRAAYFLTFGVLPRPFFIEEDEFVFERIAREDGLEIVRELEFEDE